MGSSSSSSYESRSYEPRHHGTSGNGVPGSIVAALERQNQRIDDLRTDVTQTVRQLEDRLDAKIEQFRTMAATPAQLDRVERELKSDLAAAEARAAATERRLSERPSDWPSSDAFNALAARETQVEQLVGKLSDAQVAMQKWADGEHAHLREQQQAGDQALQAQISAVQTQLIERFAAALMVGRSEASQAELSAVKQSAGAAKEVSDWQTKALFAALGVTASLSVTLLGIVLNLLSRLH